ncbi:MAG: phage head-tail connector protein, partial [Elusimicrobiota bacterium]|nr:phage head-tail connector protein [Elusimicrobiota bacterium]
MNTAATTLENLKTYLGLKDESKDALLTLLLESCTDAAEKYLGRYIVARAIE